MAQFNFTIQEVPQTSLELQKTWVHFIGDLNEFSKLPKILEKKRVFINFSKLQNISSFGVKLWCQWLQDHQHLIVIFLEDCPFVFAKNWANTEGFLAANVVINSVFVPFFSDQSGEAQLVLFNRDVHFFQDGNLNMPQVVDSQGNKMELDVDRDSYFKFLKGQ